MTQTKLEVEQRGTKHNITDRVLNTAGLLIRYTHTKNQFADEPEGLRHFRDHRWKALSKENSDLSGLFL